MGAVRPPAVQRTSLDQTPRIELPNGSWSAMVIADDRVSGNRCALGYSVFKPGTALPPVKHEVEEVALVLEGSGELQLDDRTVPYRRGDALFIPAGVWHGVRNTGDEDVVMVFCFPHPAYPPTARQGDP